MSSLENRQVFSKNLIRLMEGKNVDRKQFCEDLGLKYSTVSEWINAKKYPRIDKIEIIADYFGVSKSELIEDEMNLNSIVKPETTDTESDYSLDEIIDKYDNIRSMNLKKFPMLGEIACGQPIFADEDRENYFLADAGIKADFCLRAKGESMINARIYDGDVVFIRKQPVVENGEIAAVIISDEATLKRIYYYPEKSKLVLYPENPKFEPLIYTDDELDEIRILGKAVCFMSTL